MRTIRATFKTDGKAISRTAILTDDLSELSKSKKNQCSDILDDSTEDGFWSLVFFESDTMQYEVELEYDTENWCKMLKPIKCIVWESDIIIDEVKVELKVTQA